jgi:hypothetical protein
MAAHFGRFVAYYRVSTDSSARWRARRDHAQSLGGRSRFVCRRDASGRTYGNADAGVSGHGDRCGEVRAARSWPKWRLETITKIGIVYFSTATPPGHLSTGERGRRLR